MRPRALLRAYAEALWAPQREEKLVAAVFERLGAPVPTRGGPPPRPRPRTLALVSIVAVGGVALALASSRGNRQATRTQRVDASIVHALAIETTRAPLPAPRPIVARWPALDPELPSTPEQAALPGAAGARPRRRPRSSGHRRRASAATDGPRGGAKHDLPASPPASPPRAAQAAEDPLALELALIERARRGAQGERWPEVLRAVDEHRRRFAHGLLVSERELLRVLALCRTGRADEARQRIRALQSSSFASALRARLAASCPQARSDHDPARRRPVPK